MRSAAAALLAVLVALGASCGSSSPAEDATSAPLTTSSESRSSQAERPRAPATQGVSLDGAATALADHHGRPVLVNVWSSW